MSDIVTTSDLTVPDNSKLKTGDARRKHSIKNKKKKKVFKEANNKYKAGV